MTWQSRTIQLAMKPGSPPVEQLAEIHESELFGVFPSGEFWNVTHLPTGRRLGFFSSQANARTAVELCVQSGVDWTLTSSASLAADPRAKKVYASLTALEEDGRML